MKKIFLALAAAAALFVGCTKELEQRVGDLETSVEQIKSDLKALDKAVKDKLVVNELVTLENGYKLVFSDGTSVTLQNGAQGETGPQGPQGEKGDAFFESVELSEDGCYLVITLVADEEGNQKVYCLPMGAFNIMFNTSDFVDAPAATVEVPYTVTGAKAADVVVRVLSTNNCTAVVDAAGKTVDVTLGEGEAYVDVYAINNATGEIKAKTLTFYGYTMVAAEKVFYASPAGMCEIQIPVTTDVVYEVAVSASWIYLDRIATKAELRDDVLCFFVMDENTTESDLTATITLKVNNKDVASFNVIQKNYYPQWIKNEAGEQIEWSESFKLSRYSDMSGAETKKGTFHFELSDDPAKGAFKIVNMFYADSYYLSNGAPAANKGGLWYADVESNVLTIYAEGSEKSYSFGGNLEVLYNQDEKSFSLKNSPVEVYTFNYGSGRYAYLADYNAVVKVETPAATGVEALYGEYVESFTGMYGATPRTTVISESDNDEYDVKILFCYAPGLGSNSYDTAYAKVNADGTALTVTIPNYSNFFGPVDSFELTHNNGTLSGSYAGNFAYSATKKAAFDVKSLYGEYTESFTGMYGATPRTTVISESDNDEYDVKILFCYAPGLGSNSYDTAYAKVNADGTALTVTIPNYSNFFGPVDSFELTHNNGTLSGSYAGNFAYSATKQ